MRNILLAFFTFTSFLYSSPYEFSIASFFQNEADYLKEWIEYHRILGFEHFWLYNNNSTDHYLEVLEPYIEEGIVELFDWPSPPGTFWAGYQIGAFHDAVSKASGNSTWLALIDIDEFIVPVDGVDSFHQIMRDLEKNDQLGGLVLFWQVFGTSNIWKLASNTTLIESLTWKTETEFPLNHYLKSIVRPERVVSVTAHSAVYKAPYEHYTLEGVAPPDVMCIEDRNVITAPIRVNHYWVRTFQWFLERKIPRLKQFNPQAFDQEEVEQLNTILNHEEDTTILQFVPELKRRLGF